MQAKECPSCGLISPPSAVKCDCGFDFLTGCEQEIAENKHPPNHRGRKYILLVTWITWVIIYGISYAFLFAMRQSIPEYVLVDAQSVIWSWSSLFMGLFMTYKLRKWYEILFGIIFFFLCLFPYIGILFGLLYFGWSYDKLEKRRVLLQA